MKAVGLAKKLGEVLNIQNGYAFSSELFNEEGHGIPIIRIRDLAKGNTETFYSGEFDPRYIVRAGDFLIGMDGEFRCYRWHGPDALLNQRICRLQEFSSDVLPDFIAYGINEHLALIEAKTDYATVKHLSSKQIENIRIPLPPPSRQEWIVRILDEAEGLRKLRAQADYRTADLIPALFHEMFGDPEANPKGWQTVDLGSIVHSIEFGISEALSENCEYQPDRIAVLRIANITPVGDVDYSDLRYLKVSDKKRSQLFLKRGDLLFNWRNSPKWVGKTAIFDSDIPAIFASFLYRLRINEQVVDRVFLWFYLNRLMRTGFFQMKCRQAVSQANFGREELAAVRVMLPPFSLQRDFAGRVAGIRALEVQQAASRHRLDDLFQSLLHRAFRGEL